MKTKLTEMFGIEYPIVQSGMQWLAVPQLAAAVCLSLIHISEPTRH